MEKFELKMIKNAAAFKEKECLYMYDVLTWLRKMVSAEDLGDSIYLTDGVRGVEIPKVVKGGKYPRRSNTNTALVRISPTSYAAVLCAGEGRTDVKVREESKHFGSQKWPMFVFAKAEEEKQEVAEETVETPIGQRRATTRQVWAIARKTGLPLKNVVDMELTRGEAWSFVSILKKEKDFDKRIEKARKFLEKRGTMMEEQKKEDERTGKEMEKEKRHVEVRYTSGHPFTTLTAVRRLLEAGLDPLTADMEYYVEGEERTVPCWSNEALLKLLPATMRCEIRVMPGFDELVLGYTLTTKEGELVYRHPYPEGLILNLLNTHQLEEYRIK